jgi:hypothetical protein
MDMQTAVAHVENNIGDCIAIAKYAENWYVAIAYRKHAPFEYCEYSTHDVFTNGCETGHYDMQLEDAYIDFKDRMGL